MIISKEHRFIFIHIPKTAGTSICRSFEEMCGVGFAPMTFVQRMQQPLVHSLTGRLKVVCANALQKTPLRFYLTTAGHPTAALARLRVPDFDSYKSFAVVRNPYERMVSAYQHGRMRRKLRLDWPQFLKAANLYLQPQSNFVCLGDQMLVDRIVRFENLEQEFDDICAWIGLKDRSQLAVYNASATVNYREFITPEVAAHIERIYARDFELFGYPKIGELPVSLSSVVASASS